MRLRTRVFSLLLAFLLVMNLGIPAYAADTPAVTLTVDNTNPAVGETVTVTVGSTGISGVFGIGFKIYADNTVYEVESIDTTFTKNDQLSAKGWIKLAKIDTSDFNALTVPETIATIKLKAIATAENTSITLSNLEVTKTGDDLTSTEIVTVTVPESVVTTVKEAAGGSSDDTFVLPDGWSILTFEDADYKGGTNYAGGTNWSSLIDSSQYGGSLLYPSGATTAYNWYDQNNTGLAHEFADEWGDHQYWGGGEAISHYASGDVETYGGYDSQLTVYQNGVSGLATSGGGHNGSNNFAIHYGYVDSSDYGGSVLQNIYFKDGKARVIDHMYVNNTTYAMNCYVNGNGLTVKIGESDWVKLVATGYHADGTTATAEIYMVNGPDNIVMDWTKWDLTGLGAVTKVELNVTGSSDNGYGFSQPAYFAFDDVVVQGYEEPSYDITISETTNGSVTAGVSAAKEGDTVTLTVTPDDGYELATLTAGDETVTKVDDTTYTFVMPASGVTVTATFTQKIVPITSITLTSANTVDGKLTLTKGATETLTATIEPADATEVVVWSSSNTAVATVEGGTITAVGAGTATITAKASDGTDIALLADDEVIATVEVTVTEAADGYNVTMPADQTITSGENVEISVSVGHSDETVTAYNAYDLVVTYPEGLTYVSASGSGVEGDSFKAEHDENSKTITIIGYGADKPLTTAPVKLTFTGSSVGTYNVTVTAAYVDAAGKASVQDAPEANIIDNVTVVTINGYTVSLGEGLSADSLYANPSEDYTFTATDYSNYDYTITAKIGDNTITVNGPDENGNYTIPADQITGNITITAGMTAKTYDVTIDGTKTENAATYNTDYTFTPAKDGYSVNGIAVKIGGETYTIGSPVDGTYTIPGKDITGDIEITVDWVKNAETTVNVSRGDGISGADTATKDEDYTFSFTDTDDYDYSNLKVEIGEGENKTDITSSVTGPDADGNYTIPGNLITGPITITVERTEKNPLTIEVSEYLTLNDGYKMYLITVSGVQTDSVAKYNGMSMYWSAQTVTYATDSETVTGYGAYAWLVISNEGLDAVKTAASEKVTTAEGTAAGNVNYSGDVNLTDKVDVNDAQLVYNMYNATYSSFDEVSMLKFLNADVNSDKSVTTQDAAAVVAVIIANK